MNFMKIYSIEMKFNEKSSRHNPGLYIIVNNNIFYANV